MNKQEASNFLKKLFTDFWNYPDPKKVGDFYHQDLIGYFGDQQITFEDVVNRAAYSRQGYSKINTEILDVLVDDNRIAARLKQTSFKKANNELFVHNPLVIYHLTDDKIAKLWFLTDKPFDYKEKV